MAQPARERLLKPQPRPRAATAEGSLRPVGAEYCVTSCDLGIFVDQAAEPVAPQNPDT